MPSRFNWRSLAAVGLAALIGVATHGGADAGAPAASAPAPAPAVNYGPPEGGVAPEIRPAPAFTGAQLAAPPTDGWPTNGGSTFNQRYTPLSQINRDNIKDLKAEWRASLNGSGLRPGVNSQGQPIVYDGVIYVQTGENDVVAVSIETGKLLWQYKANLDPFEVRPCCGWNGRGVAIGEGKIFLGRIDAKLVALDQKTGKVAWSIQAALPKEGYAIAQAPLYYDGLVVTGFAGSDMGIRGRMTAYDAKDGHQVWNFNLIPGPGEFGHDTWPANSEVWKYGGAGTWQTPALDPKLGLLIFSTANPGPVQNGALRGGDNLFSDSIVALDAKTGKYKWHYQQVHHDIWDYDAPNPVILADIIYKGRPRQILSQTSKSGFTFLLDRTNGKPLIGIPEVAVMQNAQQKTAKTQPWPVGTAIVPQEIDIAPEDFDLINGGKIFTPFTQVGIVNKPASAVSWWPSSYDPKQQLVFLCGNDGVFGRIGGDPTYPVEPGALYSGSAPMRVAATARRSIWGGLDVTTNTFKWRFQWTDGCGSGSLATGGGLVFIGRTEGKLVAYNSSTGHKVWEFQLDGGTAAPASSFEYKGKQYIAIVAGGGAGGKRNDGLWLFSLSGTKGPLPAGSASPVGQPQRNPGEPVVARAPPNTRLPNLSVGRETYVTVCAACHGPTGEGSLHGLKLTNALTQAQIVAKQNTGGGEMPSFAEFSEGQKLDVAAYVMGLVKDRKP